VADQPNILLVFTDQQRHDTFTADPQFDCVTPGMDYLAGLGHKFTHAFCSAPICSPSRATMMTGLYPTQAGMPGNLNRPSGPLSHDIRTIAHRLSAAGYRCAYFGKWHLGNQPHEYGFEVGIENHDDFTTMVEARRWLRNDARKPFFCVVSFTDPHDIYWLEPGREQSEGTPAWPSEGEDLSAKPWPQGEFAHNDNELGEHTSGRWRYYRDFYARKVEKVDASVHQVVRGCFEAPARDDTWVVFTSDHGDMAGQHNIPFKGPFMYDGVVRVPLVIVPPHELGITPAESDLLTNNIDLVPTMMDMAGLEPDPVLPGRSLLPGIRGREMDDPPYIVSQWIQKQNWVTPIRMIRTRQWKYVHYLNNGEELYDLAKDPHEATNLAGSADCEDVRDRMYALLLEHVEKTGDNYFTLDTTDRQGNPYGAVRDSD